MKDTNNIGTAPAKTDSQDFPYVKACALDEAPYYVKALAMAVPAIILGLLISAWISFLPGAMAGHADFRQLYTAGYMVRVGKAAELFDYSSQKYFQDTVVSPEQIALPFIRPAYQALFFVPFSFFPYRVAYFLFSMLNVGLLTLSLQLLRPTLARLPLVWDRFPEALFLSFIPLGAALMQGQDSIILLTLLVVAFLSLKGRRDFAAGIVIALGLFKFQIVIPVVILFLLWRRWRFVLGFSSCALVLASASTALVGISQTQIYLKSLFSITGTPHNGSNLLWYPVPVQMMANVHGFFFGVSHGFLPARWLNIMTGVFSLGLLGWSALRGRGLESPARMLLIAIPVSVLVSYYAFIHDLSVLFLPLIVSLNACSPGKPSSVRAGRVMYWSTAVLFVAPMAEAFAPDHFYLVCLPILLFSMAISLDPPHVETGST